MTESIITAVFPIESEAYQAITEIKNGAFNKDAYIISEACLVKRENGILSLKDTFDTGIHTANDTLRGGLIGAFVGILGGPIGMLLGGAWGTLAGSLVDTADTAQGVSMFEEIGGQIMEGETAVIALVQEYEEASIDDVIAKYTDVNVIRQDAAEVAAEVERAQEIQIEMAKEARKQMRAERKEDFKAKVKAWREKVKARFEAVKEKHRK